MNKRMVKTLSLLLVAALFMTFVAGSETAAALASTEEIFFDEPENEKEYAVRPAAVGFSDEPFEDSAVSAWITNALTDVFENTEKSDTAVEAGAIDMAKNEYESVQLAVRAGRRIANIKVSVEPVEGISFYVSRVQSIYTAYNNTLSSIFRAQAPCKLPEYYGNGGSFNENPEDLSYDTMSVLTANKTVSFVVEAGTTKDTEPGTYTTNIVFQSAQGTQKFPLTINVYNVTIPDTKDSKFANTVWFNSLDGSEFGTYYGSGAFYNGWSDTTWQILENYARAMKKQRQNTIWVPTRTLLQSDAQMVDGKLTFTFKNFDKYLDVFLHAGPVKYFEGQHIYDKNWSFDKNTGEPLYGQSSQAWEGGYPSVWYLTYDQDTWSIVGTASLTHNPRTNERNQAAWDFIDNAYTQLAEHLKARGLNDIWYQHVLDEVVAPEIDGGIQVKTVREMYKKIRSDWGWHTLDAGGYQTQRFGTDLTDPIPQLDNYDLLKQTFQDANNKDGVNVWFYTCVNPRNNSMSRLGDYPLISTRVLNWYAWQQGLHGYLHWAWNLWDFARGATEVRDGMTVTLREWNETIFENLVSYERAVGDTQLVYPDSENLSVYEGPRSTAARDSFEDYEAIVLAAKKNPAKTREIVDSMVTNGMTFNRDVEKFYEARKQILQIAAEPVPVLNISPNITADQFLDVYQDHGYIEKLFDADGREITGDTKVGTGMSIKLYDGDEIVEQQTILIYGDADGDGAITALDMQEIKRHILAKKTLTDVYFTAGNVDKDEAITVMDMQAIKRHILAKTLIDNAAFPNN